MTYDANGNTLNDGMNSYVWDARNRLVSADNNGAGFSYDPLGRRVSKTLMSSTTNFLYDGANAVQESGTLPTANLLTGGVDERFQRTSSTETDNYLTDALGSTVALTSATGASQVQYSYSPYGSFSASGATTSNSYAYTGRETDGLGIDYYRARYYNPATGRFLSEDPIGFAGGINKYAYVGGSPTNFVDPSGMDKKNPFQCGADAASKVSLASLVGLGDAGGVTGFVANALGGNTFSGATNLVSTLTSTSSTDQQVLTQLAKSELRGPLQGIPASFVGASGPAAVNPAGMVRSAMIGNAFDAIAGADSSLVSLSGEASLASTAMTGAEFATGVGEAKFIYDGITFFGATAGCALGLIP